MPPRWASTIAVKVTSAAIAGTRTLAALEKSIAVAPAKMSTPTIG
jgi:hypothetical protein